MRDSPLKVGAIYGLPRACGARNDSGNRKTFRRGGALPRPYAVSLAYQREGRAPPLRLGWLLREIATSSKYKPQLYISRKREMPTVS